MEKIKLGVVFGGMSTEHEVSCVSAQSIINNLNKEKYEIFPLFIDKSGKWFQDKEGNVEIKNICEELKKLDVIFPVLHGLYGEDGTIQGLFELLKIPYVGCGVLASSVGMDKVYTKIIFDRAHLNQASYLYVKKINDEYILVDKNFDETCMELDELAEYAIRKLNFPMFVKPSNSGSSVGINKANNKEELKYAIKEAGQFDKKILIEEGINGREVECAVLGNDNVIASGVGEVIAPDQFYSYDAKYNDTGAQIIIPANLSSDIVKDIQKICIKAFKAIDGKGLSRVDLFVDKETDKVYINEINTLPGFTSISMYPKLFEEAGIKYSDLLDKLIELALENR